MTRKHKILLGALLVAGLMLGVGAVATQRMIDNEVEMSIDDVPAAARAAILAQAQSNAIREVVMETENGAAVYEAEVVIGGKEVDIRVAADGAVLGQEADDEEGDDEADDEEEEADESETQVAPADLPAAVSKTLNDAAPGATIKGMELETENGRPQYAIDAVIDGQTYDIEIAPDGTLLQKKLENEEDDE
jgi:uncharacterized membrane protein YkoI